MARSYRGGQGRLYYEQDWDDGEDVPVTPTWNNIARAIDVAIATTPSEAATPNRESDWALVVPGLIDGKTTAGYRVRQLGDPVWDLLEQAMLNKDAQLIAVMSTDIATVGAKGWQVPSFVLDASVNQPLNDGASGQLVFAPADVSDGSDNYLAPQRLVTT